VDVLLILFDMEVVGHHEVSVCLVEGWELEVFEMREEGV
jgi:hypothetical protein